MLCFIIAKFSYSPEWELNPQSFLQSRVQCDEYFNCNRVNNTSICFPLFYFIIMTDSVHINEQNQEVI